MVKAAMPENTTNKPDDAVLLVAAALAFVIVVGGSFLIGNIYHLDPVWLFFGWNSIGLLPIMKPSYKGMFKKPRFQVAFAVWMVVHGVIVVSLMRWVPMAYWIPLIGLEFFLGFTIISWLFGVEPASRRYPSQ